MKDFEKLKTHLGSLLKEMSAIQSLSPVYALETSIAAHDALINRYAPFKAGERVCLIGTPKLEPDDGWYADRHFLVEGAQATVNLVECNSKGELSFYLVFDDETWISSITGEKHPPETKHLYGFREKWLKKI